MSHRYLRMTIEVILFDEELADNLLNGEGDDAPFVQLERAIKLGIVEIDGINDVVEIEGTGGHT